MATRYLPSEVISLIHHVELSNSGWHMRLNEQLVLSAILAEDKPLNAEELDDYIHSNYGVRLKVKNVRNAISILVSRGAFMNVDGNRVKLAESEKNKLIEQVRKTRQLEENVKNKFLTLLEAHSFKQSPEEIWLSFNDLCLVSIVEELGARTFELLSGSNEKLDNAQSYTSFVSQFSEPERPVISQIVDAFFDPKDQDFRAYMLQSLHAYLLTRAGDLNEQTISDLSDRLKRSVSLTVFLDTNFLFSILDLHKNPSNEAAKELVELVNSLTGRVNLRLYVLPETLDEARRTLIAYESQLSSIYLTSHLGRAVSQVESNLSGITQRFVEAAKVSNQRLTAKDYFDPYISNMLAIVRQNGVELYNANTEDLTQDQKVVDDILSQQDREEQKRGERGKSYEALEHDMILWHFTSRCRPTRIDSPLDAQYWVATIDFRLLGFDAFKRRQRDKSVPICLHPTVLIQMLQLWMPRTPDYERALFQGLKSFIPMDFDADAERVTLGILRSLSRYENIDDLTEEAVVSVLLNSALRQRLSQEPDVEKQIELVHEAILSEFEESRRSLVAERTYSQELHAKLLQEQELLRNEKINSEHLSTELKRLTESEAIVKSQLASERSSLQVLESRLQGVEADLEKEKNRAAYEAEQKRNRTYKLTFVIKVCILAIIALLMAS